MNGSSAQDGGEPGARQRWIVARGWLRDVALLGCAAVAAYLLTTIAVARLAALAAGHVQRLAAPWYLALAIAALFDTAKLIGLIPAAWIVRRAVTIRPPIAASILVLCCFGLEVGVMAIVQQAAWSWGRPAIWGTRVVVLLLSILLVDWVMRRGSDSKTPC